MRVLPPEKLFLPVLPFKVDERLLFPLCRTCAIEFKKECFNSNLKCLHTDEKRCFITTTTHIELENALKNGYIVDRVYRVWHYDKWDKDLFKEYVCTFLKMKVEASGWPAGVDTPEKQNKFVGEYKEHYGIEIDSANVEYNAGLRHIAKISLNALWGKFSMRNSLCKNEIITKSLDFYQKVLDPRIEISMIIKINQHAIRMVYRNKKNNIIEHSSSNIVISLWTTSKAR